MWQAQDPVRARILGLGIGSWWPCSLPVQLASSPHSLLLHCIPAQGTLEVCRGSIVSPLRPSPLAQFGVAFWSQLDVFMAKPQMKT